MGQWNLRTFQFLWSWTTHWDERGPPRLGFDSRMVAHSGWGSKRREKEGGWTQRTIHRLGGEAVSYTQRENGGRTRPKVSPQMQSWVPQVDRKLPMNLSLLRVNPQRAEEEPWREDCKPPAFSCPQVCVLYHPGGLLHNCKYQLTCFQSVVSKQGHHSASSLMLKWNLCAASPGCCTLKCRV